jgi:hypothetical protein
MDSGDANTDGLFAVKPDKAATILGSEYHLLFGQKLLASSCKKMAMIQDIDAGSFADLLIREHITSICTTEQIDDPI